MATKNIKPQATIIDSTAKKVLKLSTKANDFALKTTEKVAMKSFELAELGFTFSNTLVKKGLQISAKQQNKVFDVLDSTKGKLVKSNKKSK